jgi:oxygen-independent coproporphyrinogen-3 oxidase
MPITELEKVFASLRKHFHFTSGMEITLEANPGTLSREYLDAILAMGINRLSLGMQSSSNQELKMLGRIHRTEDVRQSVLWARQAGFDNLSLDLIYGLPGQTLTTWRENLCAALEFAPEHLSLYALTLEPHVPMARSIHKGLLPAQDDDLMADMYELATDVLDQAGFEQYEISNWARCESSGRDLRSRHNLQYWLNLPYLGFGAGAHGCAAGIRMENLCRINAYSNRCLSESSFPASFPMGPALKTWERIDKHREMQETMMLGLRLNQGVSGDLFYNRFGMQMNTVFGSQIGKLEKLGLLEHNLIEKDVIKLTRRGRFLSNIVFREFVD